MDLADWNTNDNFLTVRSGKGDKNRTTYLDDGAAAALADWVIWRGDGTRGAVRVKLWKDATTQNNYMIE